MTDRKIYDEDGDEVHLEDLEIPLFAGYQTLEREEYADVAADNAREVIADRLHALAASFARATVHRNVPVLLALVGAFDGLMAELADYDPVTDVRKFEALVDTAVYEYENPTDHQRRLTAIFGEPENLSKETGPPVLTQTDYETAAWQGVVGQQTTRRALNARNGVHCTPSPAN